MKAKDVFTFEKETSRQMHRRAMHLYEGSIVHYFYGRHRERMEDLRAAFQIERKAAMKLWGRPNSEVEPTRSILFRSAAWMAYHAGLKPEAEDMVRRGLLNGDYDYERLMEAKEKIDKMTPYHHKQSRRKFLQRKRGGRSR